MCVWSLTCGRKGRFDHHLFWLIVCVCKFFFLDCVGFHWCNVCCNLCMEWGICLHKKKRKHFFHCAPSYFWKSFPFPYHFNLLAPSSPQLQPRHHNIDNFLWHHIIVNIFPWNKICQNPFHSNPSQLFSYQLPKICLYFQNKKSLMKPDTFDFKSLPAFPLQLYPLYHLIISPHMLLNRKTQKIISVWRSLRWNKAEWNITHLHLSWVFDLFNFPHTHTHTHTYIYIYIYIYIYTCPGFFNLSPFLGKLVLNSNNTANFN